VSGERRKANLRHLVRIVVGRRQAESGRPFLALPVQHAGRRLAEERLLVVHRGDDAAEGGRAAGTANLPIEIGLREKGCRL